MRKKSALLVVIAIIIVVSAVFASLENRIIGEISGAESERLTIGQTKYFLNHGLEYTIADKGRYLGKAKSDTSTFRLYSVKGDEEGRYIYAFWDWEGFFYVREND